ncbi:helix-turn-helix transcriptional regulator [Clostridium sp.]|uniref:helix-turn-helix domain-containing protein n=1 Tax=Clostridium sp. TaxID=1506 RepID=UPI00261F4BA6|nr:helix-turn-helix transcriptional regulator [Clostridium sp.]
MEEIKFNLYKKIYDYLPEKTLSEKIIKVRMSNNLDRKEFAEAINHHWSSIQSWELDGVYPNPNSIKNISNRFNVDLKYFSDYYYWVFNNPGKKFKEFKENEGHSYTYYAKLFDVSDSALKRIVGGKTELSYSMYLKFKELGVFKELKKKKPINYDDIPVKFKAWKKKMGYTNAQCAEILNVSIPTIKRLASGKTKFNELYESLEKLNII